MKLSKITTSVIVWFLCLGSFVAQQSNPLFDAKQHERQTAKRDLQTARTAKKYFTPLVVAAVGCGFVDSFTTERALWRGGGVEGNPFLRGSSMRRQTIAWGVRTGLLAALWKLRRKNPRAANVGLGAMAVWGCGAGAWNSRQ